MGVLDVETIASVTIDDQLKAMIDYFEDDYNDRV